MRAELEPAGVRTPADVAFTTREGRRVVVEARAVFPDDTWRAEQTRTDKLFERVRAVETAHRVQVTGSFGRLLEDDEIDELVGRLIDHAGLVRIGAGTPHLRMSGAQLQVHPRDTQNGGLSGPAMRGDMWARLGDRVAEKATKAREAGVSWLRLDARNGIWQLTHWSQSHLREKLQALRGIAQEALAGLDGLVLSSGALLGQGDYADEEVALEEAGAIALRRMIEPLRVRETLIIPAEPGGARRPGGIVVACALRRRTRLAGMGTRAPRASATRRDFRPGLMRLTASSRSNGIPRARMIGGAGMARRRRCM
jgi:hypothetical protein